MDFSLNMFLFVIGSITGSFLGMLIFRIPHGLSIVFPGSFCDTCKIPLKWYENVPIISYVVVLGKCKYCGTRHSLFYPLLEIFMGILFIYTFEYAQDIPHFIYLVSILSLLIGISIIDIKHFIIPDKLLIAASILSVGYYAYAVKSDIFNYFLGAFIIFSILFLIRIGSRYIYKKEAFGLGDVKLGALLGFILGWKAALIAIFFGFIIAGFFIVILAILRRLKRKSYLPFGPFLIMGAVIHLFFGKIIIFWYLHFFLGHSHFGL
jgi:leader peptidase (prepilin peptidase)/N-methyltransferase